MKQKKLWIALTCVFAVGAISFAGLTALNISANKQISAAPSGSWIVSADVQYDGAAAKLEDVKSNNLKGAKLPENMLDSLKNAYAVNNNLVGWLTIPGTEVDTAIVQSNDNSRYLTRDFYERQTGETCATNYGNLYLDYRCRNDSELSKNMVIYGHTTGRSTGIPKQAFRSLYDYKKKEAFIKNPIIKYSTLYGEHTYKICAVFLSTTERSSDNGYFLNYIYPDMSDNNMVGYIKQVKERMLYETGVSLEPTDKIITLSTCTYDYGKSVDTRLVIIGRLLHEGEDLSIDSSLVKDNPDYRRPQIWYNAHGKTNPYRNSEKWEPSAE